MNPVATYLSKLTEIRSSGYATNETSYYPAIEALPHSVLTSITIMTNMLRQLTDFCIKTPPA